MCRMACRPVRAPHTLNHTENTPLGLTAFVPNWERTNNPSNTMNDRNPKLPPRPMSLCRVRLRGN